ncbi:MAG: cellobiose phosphorylase [Candidatus Omnitrophota bacterium]
MDKKPKYYIDSNNEFVIENYNLAGAFSNFLPGIAGLFGIPMWAFYVNRGQGICSLGIHGKDNSIMEFFPANRAYQLAPSQSFRTFLKIKKGKGSVFYEPFRPYSGKTSDGITQKMFVSGHEMRIEEINSTLGLDVEIKYFTIPNEPFAALARIVTIKNTSRNDISIDMLDGTPIVVPCGTANFFLQKMRRTIEAWMLVENLDKNAPFYRLKVDPKDASEVKFIEEGNFYTASLAGKLLPVIVDPEVIFGQITDFSYPVNFANQDNFKGKGQMAQNKLPSGMALASFSLKKGKEARICSLLGHMSSMEKLNSFLPEFKKEGFYDSKRNENKEVIDGLKDNILTVSADKRYDTYCGQTFLDNVLRGGFPITCSNDHTYAFYVYSRKHGDLERDYNKFSIEPSYFSQGDGNYRDTNQNRRNDVFFNPQIKDFNILHFYNLIQADGYNPLVLRGVKFRLKDTNFLKSKLGESDAAKLKLVLSGEFTPGRLFMEMERLGIKLKTPWREFLDLLSKNCVTIYDAEHGEGYWIDHWTYNLDQVESFLSVYPEKLKEILLDKKEFTFYDNVFCVKPRSARYLLKHEGVVRQYHSLEHDAKKTHMIKERKNDPHLARTKNGEGDIYRTTLLVKMLCLAVNKISSLDPFGIGIEMEADKPGWCDSMNGLPGLCGSATPEVFELKRQVMFLIESLDKIKIKSDYKISMPEEMRDFLKGAEGLIRENPKDFDYWDKSNALKERYRENTKYGFSGAENTLTAAELKEALDAFGSKLDSAIKKAYNQKQKVYNTYFINEVVKYEPLNKIDQAKGLPLVRPLEFKNKPLPLFLEGPVRAMKADKDPEHARLLYKALRKSEIYDKKLKMYKINAPLKDISKEIGRSSIFTPGWLENESIWLHMEYKYILEILKAGLYKEFFEEFKNVLVPFQNPGRYARSVFENSSFIVSSAFPDARLHGRGFVARLSGSTAEMLSIWIQMNVGEKPFFLNEKGELNLRFRPALPAWLFRNGTYSFKFLGKTQVTYHNPKNKDTVSARTRSITLEYDNGKKFEIQKDVLGHQHSTDIRDRKVKKIDIYLS